MSEAKAGETVEGSEKTEGGEEAKTEEAAAEIPEAYELAMPEGFEVDSSLMEEATPVFKDLKLNNEQANRLVPMAAKLVDKAFAAQNDKFQATAADWAKQSQAAPDIGGAKWAETENNVARAMDVAAEHLAPIPVLKDGKPLIENGKPVTMSGAEQIQSFRELLANSKLGNHPTMIRMFNFFGRQVGEDGSFIRSDASAQVKQSAEEVLYPSMVKSKE